jgi:hypothetical protein
MHQKNAVCANIKQSTIALENREVAVAPYRTVVSAVIFERVPQAVSPALFGRNL